jgi:hypothetical protein
MGWGHLKILSRTTGAILTRLDTNYLWGRKFKFIQIKYQVLVKGQIITKMSKWDGVIKIFFLKNYFPRKAEVYMKAF